MQRESIEGFDDHFLAGLEMLRRDGMPDFPLPLYFAPSIHFLAVSH